MEKKVKVKGRMAVTAKSKKQNHIVVAISIANRCISSITATEIVLSF